MMPGLGAKPMAREFLGLFRRAMGNGGAAVARSALGLTVPRGHIAGLGFTYASGTPTQLSVAAGECADAAQTAVMQLPSSMVKTTAAWAAGSGSGGLDTGSIAASTTYHWYVIQNPISGAADVVFSTSASAPTLPSGFTRYRRIGSLMTNGSSQWIGFVQDGDLFQLLNPVMDISATNPGASAVTATLGSVPNGLRMRALVTIGIQSTSASEMLYVSDLSSNDMAPDGGNAPSASVRAAVASVTNFAPLSVMTNPSRQVRYRCSAGAATTSVRICTLGWEDTRGRGE